MASFEIEHKGAAADVFGVSYPNKGLELIHNHVVRLLVANTNNTLYMILV